ncbi:MAG: hypothetical protein WEA31_04555, partial [Pirellulales bacterium]
SYDTNYYLDTITDFAGRVTDFVIDAAGYVTQITLPDPDGTGSLTSPATTLEWYLSGDREVGQLKTIVLPEGNTTTIEYHTAGRFATANSADDTDWFLTPSQFVGIAEGTSLATPSGAFTPEQIQATYTNERAKQWTYTVDAFGYTSGMTDPLDFTWQYERDQNGLMTQMTEPAGAGGAADLGALVTGYEYDDRGNLLSVTYAQDKLDTSGKITESWEYDETFSQVEKYTDARGFQTINILDASGNVDEVRMQVDTNSTSYENDPDKWITTKFTYTPAPTYASAGQTDDLAGGLVLTTRDGRGVLTDYDYFDRSETEGSDPTNPDHHGLVEKITAGIVDTTTTSTPGSSIFTLNTDDETVRHFAYDANRNLASTIQQMAAEDTVTGTPN